MENQLHFQYDFLPEDESFQKVFEFAKSAHGSQRRKYRDEPYINHPVRVMETCRGAGASQEVLAAALLHDVLEDTNTDEAIMYDFLRKSFSEVVAARILKLVVELTDVFTKEDYPHLNRRERKAKELERIRLTSAEAQTIKYADILDNAPDTARYDPGFAKKMLHEYDAMLREITKGELVLYKKAVETVRACLKML